MRQLILLALLAAAPAADLPLIQPPEAAAALASANKPMVLYVGFNVLYRSKHIPGAVFAGPASKSEGLELLKKAVAHLPKDRDIILYCGCCPWDHCPNIRPAVQALKDMGYTKVKALHLPQDFKFDWIDKGYPAE